MDRHLLARIIRSDDGADGFLVELLESPMVPLMVLLRRRPHLKTKMAFNDAPGT
jgi:hypothetical protein